MLIGNLIMVKIEILKKPCGLAHLRQQSTRLKAGYPAI